MSGLCGNKYNRVRFGPFKTAICLLIAFLAAGGCADSFVLPGNHERLSPVDMERRIVEVDGKHVEVWITRSPGALTHEPQAYVLFFVGNGDRAERWLSVVADGWDQRPVEVWGMNYPGYGGSDGPTRLAQIGRNALGVYDAVGKIAGPRPIFIHAASLGTTAALCVAARRPVAGLVLHNPPPLRQLILGHYGWWNLWILAVPVSAQIPSDLDSIANATHCHAPAVFVLSGADRVVPPQFQRLVVSAYAGAKRVIEVPGASHNQPLPREAGKQLRHDIDWLMSEK